MRPAYGRQSGLPRANENTVGPTPLAKPIAPSTDGQSDEGIPPFVSRQCMLLPQNTPVGACFNGSEVQCDIIIDSYIGKAIDMNVQFDLTITDLSGGHVSTGYLAPTPYFVTRIDYMLGGQVIETQYNDTLFQESVAFQTDQEFKQTAALYNVDPATGGLKQYTQPGTASNSVTYWLNLTGFLPSLQPVVAGFSAEWRVRLYLAPNLWAAKGTTLNGVSTSQYLSVSLAALYLWVEEAGVSQAAMAEMLSKHQTGINYRSTIRNVWSITQPSLVSGQDNTQVMNAFSADSSALWLYLKKTSLDPAWSLQRYGLNNMWLQDQSSRQLTQVLPASFVENFISVAVMPITSVYTNSATFNTYIFPFCSSLDRVLHSNKVLGGYKLTGNEKVVINPTAATAAVSGAGLLQTVVSWDYCLVTVQNRQVTGVYRTASQG